MNKVSLLKLGNKILLKGDSKVVRHAFNKLSGQQKGIPDRKQYLIEAGELYGVTEWSGELMMENSEGSLIELHVFKNFQLSSNSSDHLKQMVDQIDQYLHRGDRRVWSSTIAVAKSLLGAWKEMNYGSDSVAWLFRKTGMEALQTIIDNKYTKSEAKEILHSMNGAFNQSRSAAINVAKDGMLIQLGDTDYLIRHWGDDDVMLCRLRDQWPFTQNRNEMGMYGSLCRDHIFHHYPIKDNNLYLSSPLYSGYPHITVFPQLKNSDGEIVFEMLGVNTDIMRPPDDIDRLKTYLIKMGACQANVEIRTAGEPSIRETSPKMPTP